MKAFLEPVDLDVQHVQIIARGMLLVAHSDGVHERELGLIREFYESCGAGARGLPDFAKLEGVPFDAKAARAALNSPALLEAFLGSCYLVAYADGSVSPAELEVLDFLARELHIDPATVAEVREQVKDQLMQQVAGSANMGALQKIAQSL